MTDDELLATLMRRFMNYHEGYLWWGSISTARPGPPRFTIDMTIEISQEELDHLSRIAEAQGLD